MADKKISQLTEANPLTGTEVLPIVQGTTTVKVANNDLRPKQIQSNATSGVLQVTGPADEATRVMTTPDADFTVARTDAAQTFTGLQTFNNGISVPTSTISIGSATSGMYLDVFNGTTDAQRVRVTTSGTDGVILATRSSGTVPNLIFKIQSTEGFRLTSAGNVSIANGNLVIGTSGKGIDFSATPGTGTSELLADYEEGTFTPVIIGSSSAGTGTYTTQAGSYTKIGNRVFFSLYLVWSAHTGTGYMIVDGLPFTIANNNANYTSVSTYMDAAIALTAGKIMQVRTSVSSTQLLPTQYATGGTGIDTIAITATGGFMLTGNYYV